MIDREQESAVLVPLTALYFSASLLPEVQGVILEPQIQPRPRRAFDVRGPLSPLNLWRQNIQLLERVGKGFLSTGKHPPSAKGTPLAEPSRMISVTHAATAVWKAVVNGAMHYV